MSDKNIDVLESKQFEDIESANLFCRYLQATEGDHFRSMKTVFFVEPEKEEKK